MGSGETVVTRSVRPRALEWLVRVLIALAAVGSAWVHLDLWLGGYREIHVIGPLFLVNAATGVVVAIGILVWRHWVPALFACGFGAATLGAFGLSVTVGLFGTANAFGGFHGFVEWFAASTEAVCVVGGLALLLLRRGERGA